MDPFKPIANRGKRYVISFTNDYSNKALVYFLQEKSESFGVLKSFKSHVENEIKKSINTLRIDHGGKYWSIVFHDFHEFN